MSLEFRRLTAIDARGLDRRHEASLPVESVLDARRAVDGCTAGVRHAGSAPLRGRGGVGRTSGTSSGGHRNAAAAGLYLGRRLLGLGRRAASVGSRTLGGAPARLPLGGLRMGAAGRRLAPAARALATELTATADGQRCPGQGVGANKSMSGRAEAASNQCSINRNEMDSGGGSFGVPLSISARVNQRASSSSWSARCTS